MAYSKDYGPMTPTYGNNAQVQTLLEAGIVDAQALRQGDAARLASKLGLTEIERARQEAEKIGEELGRTPQLYGRRIAEIVGYASAAEKRPDDEDLAQKVAEARQALRSTMVNSAQAEAGHGSHPTQ